MTDEACASSIGPSIPQTESLNRTAQNFSNQRQLEGDYHNLRIDFNWKGFDVTSITGYRATDETMSRDLDATQVDFYSVISEQDYDQFSQEVTISKQLTERLHFVTGLYLLDYEYSLFQEEFFILNALGNDGLSSGHAPGEIQ